MSAIDSTRGPLIARLVTYACERFPLASNGILTALMCAGSIAPLHRGSPVPAWQAASSVLAVLPLFFLMRVADEHKDFADDLAFRPERPVPRGLVSLAELRMAAGLLGLLPLGLALFVSPTSIVPLVAAIAWIGAMSVEFGVGSWLRGRPVVYLVSHMLVMPLLALVAASFAVTDLPSLFSGPLAAVLGLAFACGLVLEIGRKLWARSEEHEGVETYSRLWGPRAGAAVWAGVTVLALALATVVSGPRSATLATAAVCATVAVGVAVRYARTPDEANTKWLRRVVVLTVVAAYVLAIAGVLIR